MFQINMTSGEPIYEQLYKKVIELVIKGILKEDDPLPSVRNLAKDLGVNPNTVQKAFQELERDGIIYSVIKKGNFVSKIDREKIVERALRQLKKVVKEALTLGFTREEIIKYIKEWEDD